MAGLITLTTDFGTRDSYVAAIKGVIHRVCPDARIEDLTHDIPPQDVWEAAFFLAGAAPWFPVGTVHLVVIDPGVGTARRPIAAAAGGQVFVCPDNGVLTVVLDRCDLERAHVIKNAAFMLPAVSATFHGRDIFAPAAARLAGGADIASAGPEVDRIVLLEVPDPKRRAGGVIEGEIIHVDRFGNAVTNIPDTMLDRAVAHTFEAGGTAIASLSRTYGDAEPGAPLALIGSSGRLEIAINQGNAAEVLGLGRGMAVRVCRRTRT
ncbi:MAG TPA: SAM-dependent chlorinase/fluorinase [Candidatus Hydrogenedentes bacterium]|nr:SAM-dependent chlorinase/fluorinase [Candidatus Hydrogenedentota bacterium]